MSFNKNNGISDGEVMEEVSTYRELGFALENRDLFNRLLLAQIE